MTDTIALAYHNLSIMLAAGVPLLRSLNTISSASNRQLRRAFFILAEAVSKGSSLAETMSQNPNIFVPLDVVLIRAAETSGSLPESFGLLSKWHEFCQRIQKRILSGMALPIVLIHLTALVAPLPGFFLGGWQIKSYLTAVVRILLVFYIPAAIIYAILRMMPKTGLARRMLDRLTLKIPVLGHAVYKLALSRYCWAFHMLLKAGVPVTNCAEKSSSVAGNAVVADLLKPGATSAKDGQLVSEGFSSELPLDFMNIWRVGEETGNLDDVTKRLANNYGENAEFLFIEFARWLPRLVYWLVCLLIVYFIIRNFGKIMTSIP